VIFVGAAPLKTGASPFPRGPGFFSPAAMSRQIDGQSKATNIDHEGTHGRQTPSSSGGAKGVFGSMAPELGCAPVGSNSCLPSLLSPSARLARCLKQPTAWLHRYARKWRSIWAWLIGALAGSLGCVSLTFHLHLISHPRVVVVLH
jgi:hypothetical protein